MYETLTRYGMSIKIQRPEERDYAGRGAVLLRACELPSGEVDLAKGAPEPPRNQLPRSPTDRGKKNGWEHAEAPAW
jgi:hypothetical protein